MTNKPAGGASPVRKAAYKSLFAIDDQKKFSNLELNIQLKRLGFEGSDRALYTALVYGVLEKKLRLDYIITRFTNVGAEKIDADVLCILRMAAYQSCFLDRIPPHAICSESVELCKRMCTKPLSKSAFVNAVTRRIVTEGRAVAMPDKSADLIKYLSTVYSVSPDIARLWTDAYGAEKAEAILGKAEDTAFASRLTLRVNTLRTNRRDLAAALSDAGLSARLSELSLNALILNKAPVSELEALDDGSCFVQDEASQLCAELLSPEPGMRVLDACAAPGGKSFSLAMLMENRGTIHSCELHSNKLPLISDGARRLGVDIIETFERDASVFVPELEGCYDRVLCDAPCSGLGVIAKKPEIRYKTMADTERLPEAQCRILANCSRYLRPGGRLVYSTCTLNPAENEDVTYRFLDGHGDFTLVSERTLFPDTDGCDGFYMAAFTKV